MTSISTKWCTLIAARFSCLGNTSCKIQLHPKMHYPKQMARNMLTAVSWWPATLLFGATDLTKGVDGIVDGTIFCGPGVAAFDGICVGMLFARTGATGTFNGTALPMFSGTSNRGFFFRGVLAGILFSGTSNLQSRFFLQRSARLPHGLPLLTQPRHAFAISKSGMHNESP